MIEVETYTRVETTIRIQDNLVGLLLEQDKDIVCGRYIKGEKLLEDLVTLRWSTEGHAWQVIDEILATLYEQVPLDIREKGVTWNVWITVDPVDRPDRKTCAFCDE
jgi:hypothetical protein